MSLSAPRIIWDRSGWRATTSVARTHHQFTIHPRGAFYMWIARRLEAYLAQAQCIRFILAGDVEAV